MGKLQHFSNYTIRLFFFQKLNVTNAKTIKTKKARLKYFEKLSHGMLNYIMFRQGNQNILSNKVIVVVYAYSSFTTA